MTKQKEEVWADRHRKCPCLHVIGEVVGRELRGALEGSGYEYYSDLCCRATDDYCYRRNCPFVYFSDKINMQAKGN